MAHGHAFPRATWQAALPFWRGPTEGRAACRGHGRHVTYDALCPLLSVAQPLRSPPALPNHPLPPRSPHPCPRAAASRAKLLEVLRRRVELCDEPRVLLAQPRLVRVWGRVRV